KRLPLLELRGQRVRPYTESAPSTEEKRFSLTSIDKAAPFCGLARGRPYTVAFSLPYRRARLKPDGSQQTIKGSLYGRHAPNSDLPALLLPCHQGCRSSPTGADIKWPKSRRDDRLGAVVLVACILAAVYFAAAQDQQAKAMTLSMPR